jgi:hypothetical protein
MDSDDEVQEIDPPVIIRLGRKKYRRKILTEELDISFYHHSKRNRKMQKILSLHKHHIMQL